VRTLLMDDIHLSRQILRAVEQGKLPRSFLEEIATEHLLSRCPHCRAEFDAFEAERQAGTSVLRRLFLLSRRSWSVWRLPSPALRGGLREIFRICSSCPPLSG
jgi:hypothetical protein